MRNETIDIPVRDLSSEFMLKMMANENMAEWRHDATIDRETILAVVKDHKNNELSLFRSEQELTVKQIAKFLSWNEIKVQAA
ncbi:hypothetical protein MnTg02_02591 [bacterium MnTg02]|nr:hypothetical protein MnTg02_02591 [bacterium MnTg02]